MNTKFHDDKFPSRFLWEIRTLWQISSPPDSFSRRRIFCELVKLKSPGNSVSCAINKIGSNKWIKDCIYFCTGKVNDLFLSSRRQCVLVLITKIDSYLLISLFFFDVILRRWYPLKNPKKAYVNVSNHPSHVSIIVVTLTRLILAKERDNTIERIRYVRRRKKLHQYFTKVPYRSTTKKILIIIPAFEGGLCSTNEK